MCRAVCLIRKLIDNVTPRSRGSFWHAVDIIPMPRPQRFSSSPKQILPPRLRSTKQKSKRKPKKDNRKRTTAGRHLINDNSAGFRLSFHMFYVLKVTPTEIWEMHELKRCHCACMCAFVCLLILCKPIDYACTCGYEVYLSLCVSSSLPW